MKKSLLIASLTIFLFTSKSNAQTFNSSNLTFGVKAGVNAARFTVLDIFGKTKFVIKPMLGFYSNYSLDDNWGLRAELLYSGAGTKSEIPDFNLNDPQSSNKTYTETISLSYIYIPLLARYRLSNIPLLFLAGPQLGFLISYNEKTTDPYTDPYDKPQTINDMNRTEIALIFGAEYELENNINLGLRYHSGMTAISKNDQNALVKNRILTLSIGYTF